MRIRTADPTPCQVEGCPDVIGLHGRRGYCSAHYQRLKTFGDALYPVAYDTRKGYIPRIRAPRPCAECGTELAEQRTGRTRQVCSRCRKKRKRLADKVSGRTADSARRRKALKRGAFVERVYSARIYERDGWRCQLCGKAIKRTATVPHPLSPTIDHIIPLARGGTHESSNVQAAHFICNSYKGSGGTDQLRLVG